jgi:hypothetical protein
MIKLIAIIDGEFTIKEYPAEVRYVPKLKYLIDKTLAFTPTVSIQRKPYHEDSIEVDAILSPGEYDELYSLLNSPVGNGLNGAIFYVEFLCNDQIMQRKVKVDKLPAMSENQRFWNEKTKFSLISTFETYTPIDFENIYGYGNSYGENYGF